MNVVIPFPRPYGRRPVAHATISGFEHIPLRSEDLAVFGGEITATGLGLLAIHRDAAGTAIGRARTMGGPAIRHVAEPGSRLGLVASPATEATRRIAIASGPLPLVALAALEARRDTVYATPSGVWTACAGNAIERLIRECRPDTVTVAMQGELASRCLSDLSARLPDIEVHLELRTPPNGDWMRALQRVRADRPAGC